MATLTPPARGDVARGVASLWKLARAIARHRADLGRLEDRMHRLAADVAALARALTDEEAGHVAWAADAARRRRRQDARRLREAQRAAAAKGAGPVDLRATARGGKVRFGDSPWIPLPPLLADLARALVHVPGVAPDGFPAWQARRELRAALGRRRGRPLTPRALTAAVYRLRRLMAGAGVNPFLLQVEPRRGLRLLRRRELYKVQPL